MTAANRTEYRINISQLMQKKYESDFKLTLSPEVKEIRQTIRDHFSGRVQGNTVLACYGSDGSALIFTQIHHD